MAGKPLKKTKFELNQPLKNSLRIYKKLKANSSAIFYPYRKYDAAVVEKGDSIKPLHHSYASFINASTLKKGKNTKKLSSLNETSDRSLSNESPLDKPESTLPIPMDLGSTSEGSQSFENGFEFLPITGITLPEGKLKCMTAHVENVALQVDIKYECFQLNCNSSNVFTNFTSAIPTLESEDLLESYSSCLHLTQKYFQKIKYVKPSVSTLPYLKYNPDIDFLPEYEEMTETELSMLQRMACGCKSLTWDEFEKMYLITEKSETKHLDSIPKNGITDDPLKSCLSLCKGANQKKISIRNSRFHRHKNTSANYSPHFRGKRSNSESSDRTKKKKVDKEQDPLCLPNDASREMVDVKDAVRFVSIDHEDTSVDEKPTEIFGVCKSTMEMLGKRLNQLRAADVNIDDIIASHEAEKPSVASSGPLAQLRNKERKLRATTIFDREFTTTSFLRNFLKETCRHNLGTPSNNISEKINDGNSITGTSAVSPYTSGNKFEEGSLSPAVGYTASKSLPASPKAICTNELRDITITNVTSLCPTKLAIESNASNFVDTSTINEIEIIGESKLNCTKTVASQSVSKSSALLITKSPIFSQSSPLIIAPKSLCTKPATLLIAAKPVCTPATFPPSSEAPSIPIIQFLADESDSDDSVNLISNSHQTLAGCNVSTNSSGIEAASSTLLRPINSIRTNAPPSILFTLGESATLPIASNLQTDSSLLPVSNQGSSSLSNPVVGPNPSPVSLFSTSSVSNLDRIKNSDTNLATLNFEKARVLTPEEMLKCLPTKDDLAALVGGNVSSLKNMAFLSIPLGERRDRENPTEHTGH